MLNMADNTGGIRPGNDFDLYSETGLECLVLNGFASGAAA